MASSASQNSSAGSSSPSAPGVTTTPSPSLPTRRSRIPWTYQETRTLIALWEEDLIQSVVESSHPKRSRFEWLAAEMAERGFSRDAEQCRDRAEVLKRRYDEECDPEKDRLGLGPRSWPYFEALDRFLFYFGGEAEEDLDNASQEYDDSEDCFDEPDGDAVPEQEEQPPAPLVNQQPPRPRCYAPANPRLRRRKRPRRNEGPEHVAAARAALERLEDAPLPRADLAAPLKEPDQPPAEDPAHEAADADNSAARSRRKRACTRRGRGRRRRN